MSDPFAEDFVYIDRCALVVRPTWKFAEWLNSLDTDPVEDETEIFINTVYLVDFIEGLDVTATTAVLEAYHLDIAASEFGAWWTDESDWPAIRNLNDFLQYFECVPSETVIDLAADSDDYDN
ncbi:MAG TPA: hypothetical protein PLA50_11055 [Bacteroidia bacterium]|nr:hypothetical protein [Bacteroidia bacterium]